MVSATKSLAAVQRSARTASRIASTAAATRLNSTMAFKKKKKGGARNLSRKEVVVLQRLQRNKKMETKQSKRLAKSSTNDAKLQHALNKKSNRAFDHKELRVVSDGLADSIAGMGEEVTPLSTFACAATAIAAPASSKKHLPYLLTIAAACLPRLSQKVLLAKLSFVFQTAQRLVGEHSSDHLIVNKAMKLAQAALLQLETPTPQILGAFRKFESSKLNGAVMASYLTTFRKLIQNAAYTNQFAFYEHSLPLFVEFCIEQLTEVPGFASPIKVELCAVFDRTISPSIVARLPATLDHVAKTLTQLFKPHTKGCWTLAADVVTTLFSRVSHIKRTDAAHQFHAMFPCAGFLLRVLDKLHQMEDADLNPHLDKAIIAVGSCMSVREFSEALPFDPRQVDTLANPDEVWKRSYTVNIIRRIAHHDNLAYFVAHYFPLIDFCQSKMNDCTAAGREDEHHQWAALHQQYWRVGVGFCACPLDISNESFRGLAKALVGLLGTSLVDTAATAVHVLCGSYYKLATTDKLDSDLEMDDEDDDEGGKREKTTLEEDEGFITMHDKDWNPHVYHHISQERAQEVCAIFTKYSTNIMPKLCNTFENHDTTAVLNAITSFSKVCSAPVMNTILQGILDLGANITDKVEATAMLSSKRRVVLDIACAIVSQLPQDHLEAIFTQIVEPVLSDTEMSNRLLQKKAYKLLFALFDARLKDLVQFLPRITQLLATGQQHITVSGLKMRVKCLNWILDAYKIYLPDQLLDVIKGVIPEVVLFARERSSGAREMAMEVLGKMQRFAVSMQCPPNFILYQVLAGLSGKTAMMISCSVVALAKIMYLAHDTLAQKDVTGVVTVCASLLEHAFPEVRAAAANFTRMVLKLMKRSSTVAVAVEEAVPKITHAIALTTSQTRVTSTTRTMMRVLCEKLIKRFGVEKVGAVFPLGSKRFLEYCHKMLRRELKKRDREHTKVTADEFRDTFLGEMRGGTTSGDLETANLLEDGALSQFVAHRSALPFGGKHEDDEDDDMCVVFEEGKLRVVSKKEKSAEDVLSARRALANKLLHRAGAGAGPEISTTDATKLNEGQSGALRKRKRDDVTDFENEELIARYGGKGDKEATERNIKKLGLRSSAPSGSAQPSATTMKLRDQNAEKRALKKARMESDVKKGEDFASTKGEGDIKRGNVDPFAYVPLNRKFMNKRHKRHAEGRFETVMGKGIMKGGKAKAKSKK